MKKVFDCSNSKERPKHRIVSLCPIQNTIVRDLKDYAHEFGYEFVESIFDADLLFTNDVFPKITHTIDLPKVKRMDGVFQLNDFKSRNTVLNESARISDHVIFISEYSKLSFQKLYNIPLKNHSVILNYVDDEVFYPLDAQPKTEIVFSACCSNWARAGKRLLDLIKLSLKIPNKMYLIGKCNYSLPKNIIRVGYQYDDYKITEALNRTNAFINLSYKDASPKTVCQAVACGLPVLFADSGGTPELIRSGYGIGDCAEFNFEDEVPSLDINEMLSSYDSFVRNFDILKEDAMKINRSYNQTTLKSYFNVFESVL